MMIEKCYKTKQTNNNNKKKVRVERAIERRSKPTKPQHNK